MSGGKRVRVREKLERFTRFAFERRQRLGVRVFRFDTSALGAVQARSKANTNARIARE
ncbi:MAG: hypothetical protein AB8H86_21115 [Polyangiales bacterium]